MEEQQHQRRGFGNTRWNNNGNYPQHQHRRNNYSEGGGNEPHWRPRGQQPFHQQRGGGYQQDRGGPRGPPPHRHQHNHYHQHQHQHHHQHQRFDYQQHHQPYHNQSAFRQDRGYVQHHHHQHQHQQPPTGAQRHQHQPYAPAAQQPPQPAHQQAAQPPPPARPAQSRPSTSQPYRAPGPRPAAFSQPAADAAHDVQNVAERLADVQVSGAAAATPPDAPPAAVPAAVPRPAGAPTGKPLDWSDLGEGEVDPAVDEQVGHDESDQYWGTWTPQFREGKHVGYILEGWEEEFDIEDYEDGDPAEVDLADENWRKVEKTVENGRLNEVYVHDETSCVMVGHYEGGHDLENFKIDSVLWPAEED